MDIKKVEFNERPQFIENEGNVVRINFDIEETKRSIEGGEEQDIVLAHVVRVEQPLTEERVKQALLEQGYDEYKADEVAAMVMQEVMTGCGNAAGALAYAKKAVIARIRQYDCSDAVNKFTFNGLPMWLDDATRTKLAKRFDTDEQDGKTETKVIYEGQAFDLPITSARAMLHQIESYARDCFDQTNEHIAAVNALDNIEDVLAYDFTEGYEPNPEF